MTLRNKQFLKWEIFRRREDALRGSSLFALCFSLSGRWWTGHRESLQGISRIFHLLTNIHLRNRDESMNHRTRPNSKSQNSASNAGIMVGAVLTTFVSYERLL
ncbi:hypothetical protein BYT27DRAFT_7200819 [Phlegmacium glaucopus]|nr:hypothetical protein BYT27DRAFT_7200819 [Phlegmacium glaucopus]